MSTLSGYYQSQKKYRYFIECCFVGSAYHGWQIQKNAISVQEVFNKALSTLLRCPVATVGCGRTDTGVHATQFYVHFDADSNLANQHLLWIRNLNALLPSDIAVRQLIEVPKDAHARFDAILRSYIYRIHFDKNPFLNGFSYFLKDKLAIDLMNVAAEILFEYQDFSCFSKSHTQTLTNDCIISKAKWERLGEDLIFYISANRFLRNMVRAIVGTLLRVGRSEIKPTEIHHIVKAKDRSCAGISVPACGLYLTEITYPYISSSHEI